MHSCIWFSCFRRLSLGFQFVQQSRIAIAHCMHTFIQVRFALVIDINIHHWQDDVWFSNFRTLTLILLWKFQFPFWFAWNLRLQLHWTKLKTKVNFLWSLLPLNVNSTSESHVAVVLFFLLVNEALCGLMVVYCSYHVVVICSVIQKVIGQCGTSLPVLARPMRTSCLRSSRTCWRTSITRYASWWQSTSKGQTCGFYFQT